MNILKIFFALSFFCFNQTSLAADNTIPQQPTAVACRYEMTVTPTSKSKKPSKNAWFFWRKPGMVQTMDADGVYGEMWEQTVTDNIYYRKLYHSDKTAVEYMPADNPTNNLSFDWVKLSSMLSLKELNALKPVKKIQVLGRNAELRKGKVDGQSLNVKWLTNENLPASIVRKDKTGTVELRLLEIEALASSHRKPIAAEAIASYRHIDAVDFGDMENDPFVKKVLAAEGHHHH